MLRGAMRPKHVLQVLYLAHERPQPNGIMFILAFEPLMRKHALHQHSRSRHTLPMLPGSEFPSPHQSRGPGIVDLL